MEDPRNGGIAPDGAAGDDTVSERAIAVIGMAGRFPGAQDLGEFWRNLEGGREAARPLSDEELLAAGTPREVLSRPDYVKAASTIDGVEEFDADFFGYSAREAEILDPQQRLFLEYAWTALEDAGYTAEGFSGLIGVYAGVAWNTYLLSNLMAHRELFDGADAFQIFITNDKDFMPTRVSYKLNLKGPSVVVQTSCSTSLVATHMACLALQNYECDMALVGGVTVKVPGLSGYFYQEGGLASPDGHCRAFDARAAGTIFGSGIGVVVLKRLAEAVDDGDSIRAVIRGSAINNDGSVKVSYTAPSVEGQAEVIAAAQEMAEVDPETIRYVECHGTGTALGDPIEVRALTKVFGEATEKKGFCALGSVKSNVGHLDAAAGVAGLIKAVLALGHKKIPPSLHFESPNPAIDFDASPFYVARELEAWDRDAGTPRRAGVSSFGVGGTNAHVILEEAPDPQPSGTSRDWQLLLLSARSAKALAASRKNLSAFLEGPGGNLADVAFTLRSGRAVHRQRWATVCRDRTEAVDALAGRRTERTWSAVDSQDPRPRPVAFLFPGQGSQHIGMARGLYKGEEVFREAFDRCAGVLERELGEDLLRLVWPEPEAADTAADKLGRTRWTQPALFAVEYATAELWRSWGVEPRAMLGHSIGEYVAATLARVFELDDVLRLVALRGRLMDELPAGAMLAVPLGEGELGELLRARSGLGEAAGELAIAALNEPERSVVSGPQGAVEALAAVLAERGLDGRRLHTSHAFHSPMMDPILEPFAAEVRKVPLGEPELPFVSNVTGTWITAQEATDPLYWARHLRHPVRFADGVTTLSEDPQRVFLEVGPGRALATLASRHPARRPEQSVLTSLRHPGDEDDDQASCVAALGRLWLAGVELDPAAFYASEKRRRLSLPTYPFERRRYWIEAGPAAGRFAGPGEETPLRQQPDVADWFYLPAWRPSLLDAAAEERLAERWLVLTLPGSTFGETLTAQLRERGRRVVTVEPGGAYERRAPDAFVVDPGKRDGYEALVEALAGEEALPEAIVHAWTLNGDLEAPPVTRGSGFERAQARGFGSLLALTQVLAGRVDLPPEVDVTVVADGIKRLTAREPLRPEKATLLGLCLVLPQELPVVRCRAVDSSGAEPGLATRILAEVAASTGDEVVAYRGRQRWVETLEPVRFEAAREGKDSSPAPLRQQGVYLLTGGLQGNGYALARYLAKTARARLALVEPAAPGARGTRQQRVAALEELGAEILLLAADLTDAADLERAVAAAEDRWGPVNGILHTAGTDGESTFRSLLEIDAEHLDWHFRPKVHGTLALEEALGRRQLPQLDFCLLLSSLASVLGGLAYGAYTAANHFLEAFAQDREARGSSLPWSSVAWDVWELEDEEQQITALRADLAELAMTPRQGEEAFVRILERGLTHVLVSTGDLGARIGERRRRIVARRTSPVAGTAAGPRHPRPELQTPYAEPGNDLERRIAAIWQEFLGFEQIGVHDNFFDLGGDSFIAVRVAARLNEALEMELPVARLYQRLTVRGLAELLAQDADQADEERARQLAERRESMDRRKALLKRRRSRKKVTVET